MQNVMYHNGTPAFADVFSGATHRPRGPEPGEKWQDWALDTHGYARAARYIFSVATGDSGDDTLYSVPLAGPSEPSNDDRVRFAREQFAEPNAAVLVASINGRQWLVALNEDGTRACTIQYGNGPVL